MAHTKAGGTTDGNRDSNPKRRGVKLYGGQKAHNGSIIIRQVGSKFGAGFGTKMGKDFTIYAIQDGIVNFTMRQGKKIVRLLAA